MPKLSHPPLGFRAVSQFFSLTHHQAFPHSSVLPLPIFATMGLKSASPTVLSELWFGIVFHAHLFLLWSLSVASAQEHDYEPPPVPPVDEFRLRRYVSIAVLDNYAYIDGGTIGVRDDGTKYEYSINVTLSLLLNRSWTNETVDFQVIEIEDPKYYLHPLLWPDPETSSIYHWRGSHGIESYEGNSDFKVFKSDGLGGGNWSMKAVANPSVFNGLYRASSGPFTTCNGQGFTMSGLGGELSDERLTGDNVIIPGLVTYEMATSTWANETTESLNYIPWRGRISCLASAGSKGLLAYYGQMRSMDSDAHLQDQEFSTFKNISLYDMATKQWLWQGTSGDAPDPMFAFCSVAVQGQNGTHEIFVFGGTTTESRVLSDVWILTIPGFHWFKLDAQTVPRVDHECALVGKRQMLVVGGRKDWGEDRQTPDPWTQGIGIFDLSAVTWSDKYDADAPEYVSPDMVNDWYSAGGSAKWDSHRVSTLFEASTTQTAQPTDTEVFTGQSDSSNSDSTPIGPIVGGTVGGVTCLVAIIGAVWYLQRRKLDRGLTPGGTDASRTQTGGAKWDKPELSGQGVSPVELEAC
ncbi:hypothetical protein EDB81DRAFT_805314 [Dactylonectria macrodidyma]|uniref:Kelch repeat protein n=1 Tax=Dactylonectria macrodidyma TaxID=307937 RepID=A0A9P9EAI2_9HYPO|nr:hypothetical protein EDB81DRAFT_805314 [Dactylonectria macrodidyma]